MTNAQKFWFSLMLIVIIGLTGVTVWKVFQPNDQVDQQLAALDAKIEATNAALAKLQTAASGSGIEDKLAQLDAKVARTNVTLAGLQKGAQLKSVSDKLEALNTGIKSTDEALAKLGKSVPHAGLGDKIDSIGGKIDAIGSDLKGVNATLASIKQADLAAKVDAVDTNLKSVNTTLAAIKQAGLAAKVDAVDTNLKSVNTTLAAIKQAGLTAKVDAVDTNLKSVNDKLAALQQGQGAPAQKLTEQLAAVNAQIKSLGAAVAALPKTGAGASASTDQTGALAGAVGDLKKNVEAAASLGTKLADQVAKLQDAVKAAEAAAKPKPNDLVVVYLHMPNERPLPKTMATVPPLTVQFEHIGSTSDKGQAQAIIAKLKDIIKGRKECTISVVGYADTLGSDDLNLEISKKRAAVVAEQLKAAFAGTGVQINQAAWGERRLKDWTPDATPNLANRRVDIAVNCKG